MKPPGVVTHSKSCGSLLRDARDERCVVPLPLATSLDNLNRENSLFAESLSISTTSASRTRVIRPLALKSKISTLLRTSFPRRADPIVQSSTTCSDISKFAWNRDQLDFLCVKARHIEIVIPDWAYPLQRKTSRQASNRTRSTVSASEGESRLIDFSSPIPIMDSSSSNLSPSRNGGSSSNATDATLLSPDGSMSRPPTSSTSTMTPSPAVPSANANLSSLVGNAHVTSGDGPPSLVGASTTVSGDKLFVFGGRKLSKRRTQLTQEMYELDLMQKHWTRLRLQGEVPAPRYFHSMCSLGDSKLVCYGGMAPAPPGIEGENVSVQLAEGQEAEQGITVLSDIHIYDIATQTWQLIPVENSPPGRYAHCATVLPSTSFFTSSSAASHPTAEDGEGGAKLVVVGGQDSGSQYIEQANVFNLRSRRWTDVNMLGNNIGAYRSVAAPLVGWKPSDVASMGLQQTPTNAKPQSTIDQNNKEDETTNMTLIYSNYNFLDVKLELQIRTPDGQLIEKKMSQDQSPPGLRFPNGEVLGDYLVVSGTFLTSSKHEYSIFALNLKTLTWTKIDAGPGILTTGSWNRGVLWKKRNTFVVLGDRRRFLAEDYNHRRLNFSNFCTVELEAFGLYQKPSTGVPLGLNHQTPSSLTPHPKSQGCGPYPVAVDLTKSVVAQTLGLSFLDTKETADMDILAIGGERVPVNSYVISRRWGPYLFRLLSDENNIGRKENGDSGSLLRLDALMDDGASRMSAITIKPDRNSVATATNSTAETIRGSEHSSSAPTLVQDRDTRILSGETLLGVEKRPTTRSRVLYLPHSVLTIRALVYYLYTWTLPPINSELCTNQILCSLLQIARPYQIDGLLESTIQALHEAFDGRNTAAVFNAAAMAAGGGDDKGVMGDASSRNRERYGSHVGSHLSVNSHQRQKSNDRAGNETEESEDESGNSRSTSASSNAPAVEGSNVEEPPAWSGGWSEVIGLQKRGLRGLMETRRHREPNQNTADPSFSQPNAGSLSQQNSGTSLDTA